MRDDNGLSVIQASILILALQRSSLKVDLVDAIDELNPPSAQSGSGEVVLWVTAKPRKVHQRAHQIAGELEERRAEQARADNCEREAGLTGEAALIGLDRSTHSALFLAASRSRGAGHPAEPNDRFCDGLVRHPKSGRYRPVAHAELAKLKGVSRNLLVDWQMHRVD
jgi:hypothetical protein